MEDIAESKNTWTLQEEEQVFRLHSLYGNKWSAIATRIPGRTENSIKNKFYSTLRRGLRKINKYISKVRRKTHKDDLSNNKIIPPDFLTKLSAIADGNFSSRYEAKPKAVQASQDIKQRLIHLAQQSYEYDSKSIETFQLQQDLLLSILQFKKHCKKRKGKKKAKVEGNVSRREKPQIESSSGQSSPSCESNSGASKNQSQYPEEGDQLRNARTQVKIQQELGGQNPVRLNDPQERFVSLGLDQGQKHSGNIDGTIKNPLSHQQNIQSMFGHYPMTASTLLPANYSFLHMIAPSQSFHSYPSYHQGYLPNMASLDTSRTSLQWELMSSQTLDHRFCFLEQIPMMFPKQQSISLAESAQADMRQDPDQAIRRGSSRRLGTSQAYQTSFDGNNNNSRLVISDSLNRTPLIKAETSIQCKEQESGNRATIQKQ